MHFDLKNIYEQHLIDCIQQQCPVSKNYIDQNRNHFASNRHSSGFSDALKELTFALTGNRSEAAYVYDLDGNKYIDITMGFGVHLFGHSPAFIKEAITQQMENGMALGPVNSNAAETALIICQMTTNDRCAFFNSGTEAIMVALRLARAATGKNRIVIFEGAYHGTHDSLLIMKQHPVTKEAISHIPGISASMVQDTVILPFGSEESCRFIEKHCNEIAAVLTEPVRSRHPEEVNPDFLRQLQQICVTKNICFILDEVATGFRMANGGAKSIFALDPDMTVYGKVLGGGLPIGVVAGKKKYLDFIDGGNWNFSDDSHPNSPTTFVAGTFCHHPLTMAASKAVLKFLWSNGDRLQNELSNKTEQLIRSINEFCKNQHLPVRLSNFGSLFRFLIKGKGKLLYHALLKEKVYLWEGRTCFLSTSHQDHDLLQLEKRIIKCLVEMKSAGFFPAVKISGKNNDSHAGFFQMAFEINECIDEGKLALAFQYTCENISISNQVYTKMEFLFFPGELTYDILKKKSNENTHELRLIMGHNDNKTLLSLQFSKNHFDGWSMIVFTRFLSKCYTALEKGYPLPANSFISKNLFEGWLNVKASVGLQEQFPASVIHKNIRAPLKTYNGTLFEYLLACFAKSLGDGKHTIGVPLSGQLISRHINTIGPCSCQVPIVLDITAATTRQELSTGINHQLKKLKKEFRYWFSKKGQTGFPVVFNIDNPQDDFLFANKKIKWVDLEETLTSHDIVCNVRVDSDELHLTIKYKNTIPVNSMELTVEKFISLIIQHEHVREYSK